METPWLDNYPSRKWTLVVIRAGSAEHKYLRESLRDSSFEICGAESERAKRIWEKRGSTAGVIFFDYEQLINMDLDQAYGILDYGVLDIPWLGYPAGTIIMAVCKGITEDPPLITVAVCNP